MATLEAKQRTEVSERLIKKGIETWALLPFYSFPTDCPQSVEKLKKTAETVAAFVNHVVVVNDGVKGLTKDQLPRGADLYRLDTHLGKAAAIREGVFQISQRVRSERDLIIQADADFDQDPRDTVIFLNRYEELSRREHQPTLLIGDRYHNSPDNLIRYRRDLLAINRGIISEAGYRIGTGDLQSGFRAYSVDLAKMFGNTGKSYRYGIEVEQAIIAMAKKVNVESVFLSTSRIRTASTDALKWIENFAGILDHTKDFGGEKGQGGNLIKVWTALEIALNAMQERKDVKVTIPVAGQSREFYFFMPDEKNYTVVSLNRPLNKPQLY